MAGSSPLKNLHALHVFTMKSPSPSTLSFVKLKTLVQTFILSRFCSISRAVNKAKSILIHLLKETQLIHLIEPLRKNKNNKNKLFLGSFRLHYNWCSSHVLRVPTPMLDDHFYYDSTWNSFISEDCDDMGERQLSGYLHWIEEKKVSEDCINEVDRLADIFIANCHEKFKLEKQESYRRFQEMMARSL